MAKRLLACLAVAAALPAGADDPTRRGFDPDLVKPALFLDGGFAVETAAAAPRGSWGLTGLLDAAGGLLALSQGDRREDLLRWRASLHLLGSWSLGRVELAAHLPAVLRQRSDLSLLTDQGVTGPLVDPIATSSLGDLRLGAKVPLLEAGPWPLGLAALLEVRLPTGQPRAFTSDGLSALPSLVATRRLGRLRLDGQLGYLVRRPGQYAQLVVHDGLDYRLGASFDLPPLGRVDRWRAIGEVTGGWPRGFELRGSRYRAPLSARTGLRAWLSPELSVEAGGGAGLGEAGYGHERWRVFAGVRWHGRAAEGPAAGPEPDRDGDGVPDRLDLCPDEPGPKELDGCPDSDGDGIPDREDRCPREPGPASNDGCPLPEDEPLVQLESRRLSLNDSIHFDTDRDVIKPESFKILDQVARLTLEHPELERIRVEGHTDDQGSAAYNKELSQRRAAAVVRYLVGKGVATARLVPAGFGLEQPVASNATALGRAKNRRVVFTILGEADGPARRP